MVRSYTERFNIAVFIFTIFTILCIVCMIAFPFIEAFKTDTYVVTIIDKGYSGEEDGYMIWAEDENGVQYEFTNKDKMLRGKFDSGTIQGKLKEGSTYEITTCGWRIPLFSAYPNIIEYKLIENDELREN